MPNGAKICKKCADHLPKTRGYSEKQREDYWLALASSTTVSSSPNPRGSTPSVTTPRSSLVDSPLSVNTTPISTISPSDGGSSSTSSGRKRGRPRKNVNTHTQVRKSIQEVRNGLVELLDKFPLDDRGGLLRKALLSSDYKSLLEAQEDDLLSSKVASDFFNLVAGLPETSQFRAELVRVTSRAHGGSLTRKEQQAFWSVSRQSLCAYDHKPTDLLNEIKKTPQAGAPRKALGFVWRAQQFWFDICSSSSATEVIRREVPDEGLVILRPIYWLTVPLIEAYRAFKEFTSNLLGYHTFVACRPKQVKDAQVVTCLCVHCEDGKDAKAQLARLKLRQSTLKPGETLTAKQLLEVREHEQTISEYESHKKLYQAQDRAYKKAQRGTT